MGDNENYTFSSAAKRKPKKLRIKKTNNMNNDDDAVGASDEPRRSTYPSELAASSSPSEAYFPSRQISPSSLKDSSLKDSPETQRRRLALKMSRLKKYEKDGDQAIPAVTTLTSGDSLLDSSLARSTGNGSSNRADSLPYVNPQEDSSSRNVHHGSKPSSFTYKPSSFTSKPSSFTSKPSSFSSKPSSFTTMVDDELCCSFNDSDRLSDIEVEDYKAEELKEDGALAKVPTQRYEKYRSVLGRSSSNEEVWEKPKSKLGAPPSFDYDPSQPRQRVSMFGGTSDVESSAYKLPPGTLDGAKPQKSKSKRHPRDSPVPESKILDKEDMAMLQMMLLGDDSSGDDDDISDGVSFLYKNDSEVIVPSKTAKRTAEVLYNKDSNQVHAAVSEDVDMVDSVCAEVSYYSSEVPMSEQGERAYAFEAEPGNFENRAEMLTFEEGDEVSEVEEDDPPNHRAMVGIAAISGAAAAKQSLQRDVEELTESKASERDEPAKSAASEQSESMAPVAERIDPAKKEREERKSEASAIAAAVAASGYKSNLVHKEVEKAAPKKEAKVERMVQLKVVPKLDSALNDNNMGGFENSQGDDDDFSDIWEQSVEEENKGRQQSPRGMGNSDEASFPSRKTEASSLRNNEADSTANSKKEGKPKTGFPLLVSSKSTGKDTDASPPTDAKGAGEEADSQQANNRSGGKKAVAGAAAGYALASTTRPPADTPQARSFQQNESESADSTEGSMDLDFGADSQQANDKNGGKKAAAGSALASTTRPPADTPQDRTFKQNDSDSADSAEGSMDLDFGNGPLQTGDDDDNSMDSFSLGASKDIESLITSKYDKEEYKPKRSGSEVSLSLDGMEAMNTGMKDFEGLSDSDLGKMETGPVDKPNQTSSKETKSSSATTLRKPTLYSGARRNCVRGTMILLLLAAVGVPTYFLITGQESRADKDIQSINLFGPLPTSSPSQSPVLNTMRPQPTIAPVSPTIQPAAPTIQAAAPTPSPTAVTPRPTTQSPSMQPVTPTASPSKSRSLRPTTPSPTQSPTMNPVNFLEDFLTAVSPDLQAAFTDTTSPQYIALLWLSTYPNLLESPKFKIIQRFALATFYLATGGDAWANNDKWLTDVDECLWYSSSTNIAPCNFMGSFISLELELNNIGGALPTELSLLSNSLTRIDLTRTGSKNFLSGPIPPEFGQLTKLEYFSLRGNQITGSLPPTIGQWTLLEIADLSNNLLSEPLPEAFGMLSELRILDLDGNQFSGSIPTAIGRLTKIKQFSIANNRLTGPIPSEIGRMFLLEDLNLEQNELTTLPAELGNLILMRFLSVSKNNIAGPLPPHIGSLINVLALDLSENALSGTIPTEMGSLFLIRGMLSICVASFSLVY